MVKFFEERKSFQWFRLLCSVVLLTFIINVIGEDAARAWSIAEPQNIIMPLPGVLMPSSPEFSLPTLKGISIDPNDPFKVNFVVDSADQSLTEQAGQEQVNLLVRYFLSFLTLPEEELWVNLSPYEKNRIITPEFETTNAGRDMLVEDYTLKQLAASLTYPDHQLGKEFWKRVFKRVQAEYGTNDIPVTSFSKVWVVPDKAVVYEDRGSAFIGESRLKVLTEEDYLSIAKNSHRMGMSAVKEAKIDHISSDITREIIIPELEREVNEGKYFAPLRQMYNSLILAIWFKKRYKEDLIYQVYVNQKKTTGIALSDKQIKEKIYARYLKALKKGVYNYIKEEADPLSNEIIPRKYFSGGFSFVDAAMSVKYLPVSRLVTDQAQMGTFGKGMDRFTVILNPIGVTKRALMSLAAGALIMAGGMHEAQASESNDLTQINKDITTLKVDIAGKENTLHKQFMHGEIKGGQYQMRWAAIGYEEGKLKKLQKQVQLIEVERHSGYLLPQMNKDISALKADIAAKKDALHKEFMQGKVKGGEYLMRSSAIGYEEGKLAKLQKQMQLIESQQQQTTVPLVIVTPVVAPTVPTQKAAVKLAPTPAAPVPTATPAPIPQPVITPSIVTHPVAATQVGASSVQVKINGTSLDITNAVVIPVEDHETAVKDGIVTGFDPDKKEYKAGERIFYLLDPELKSRIEQSGMELARANQEKESSVITAPHDLTIEGETAVPEGTQVNKGETLFRYFDQQRVRVNFNVPTGLSYFNRVQGLTINGVPVKSIVSMKWSFDPLEKNTQVSLEIIPASPMPPGQAVLLKATLLPPDSDQDLNSVVGKSSTLASVRSFEQYIVRSPVNGPVKFIVHEGQRFHKGQVLAYVYRLNGKLFEIRAPSSGAVISVAGYEQKAFQSQDELLRIRMGNALVGNINEIKDPVLFPRAFTINNGDPVVVETPQGIRLPGRVSAVNQNPYSSTMDLSRFQSLEVMAVDQQGILQTNLPVKIILSKDDKEKKIIGDALARAGKEETNTVTAGSPPPPDEETDPDAFILSTYGPLNTTSSSSVDLLNVARMVGTNELVIGNDVIKALQAKAAEAYPKASSFSLTGGVYMTPEGKVAFNGGVMGALNNSFQGGISSGNAISAAAPLVLELVGNVTKVLSGEVKKETARAVENTKVVYHHMETGINHHVNEAQDLLIDIGDAQQKIERLKQLEAGLEKAGPGIGALPGESTGASTVLDIDQQLEQKIQDVKAQILELEAKQKDWTASLNFFISQSNTYSNESITAVLPWGKDFPTISAEAEANMEQGLTGPGSVNPRMQEVMAADKFAEMSIGLQKLKRLPVLNIGSVVVNNGAGLNPFYDLSEPWTGQRSSTLQGGANSVVQGQVDLVNTGLKTEKIIVTLAEKNSKLNIAVTKAELSQELQQAVGSINSLSEQIKEAEKNYQYANDVWKSKVRSDLYLPYQLIDYRIEMSKRWQEVVDLKAQYLKEEAALRSMGLLGAETSTQQDLGDIESYFQSVVSNSITGTLTNDLQSIEEASNQVSVDPTLAPGTIDYQVGPDVSSAWALMHNDPMATMKKVLIEDPNIFVRSDALHHFLDEYQNDKEFLPSLKEVILHSNHADVVWGILKYMGQRDDRDMRFFVEIIDEAESDNNQLLVDLGFQALGDMFTAHPEDLQKLTQANFTSPNALYPHVNPETANKVFLSFLALQPDDSIAKERFLQSDFWNTDDLAKIHQGLASYIDHHKAEAGIGSINDLAKLILDSILRKEAVANIDEVFQPGAFASLGTLKYFIQPDVIMHVQITENAQGTRDFLVRSPDWRNMEKVIHPKLWVRVNQETQDLLSTPAAQQVSGDPLYRLSPSGAQHHELVYFESLGLDGQQDYIQKSQDILELTRILAFQTPLRTVALDRLMATDKGRSVVLKTYLESSDPELLQLIESRPWMEALRMDVPKASDAADNYIFRAALQKMYDRTGQEGYLYLRLRTYPDLELRLLEGPLRDASIKRVATERAIKVYAEQINITPPWAGWSFESTRIKDELANINHMIDQELDPRTVDQYINQRINADGDIGTMLKNVKNVRDQIAEKISTNDQNIPKFPLLEIIGFVGCGLTFMIVLIKKVYGRLRRIYSNPHKRIGIVLFKLLGPSDKAQMGDMVSEAPEQVFSPTTQALKNWYGMVSNWDRKEHVPAERIITEVHTILNCAEEALRLMPYSADLMYSGQGQDTLKTDIYQKTYSYYIVLALDTLNMMNEHLKGQDLNEIERQQVQAETKILVDYIRYATRFRRILYYRGSIERVIGYKFSTKHWTEWTLLAPTARIILWDTFLWRISENRLKKELPLLLDEGNSLMPGFYQDKQAIINETGQLLKKATNRGGSLNNTLSRDARHKARMGAFMGRLKYLVGFGWTIYAGIMLLLSPGLISPQFSSMVFVLLVTTTYFTYWGPYLDILEMDWNKDIAVELKVQDAISKKILNLPKETGRDKDSDENIVALSQLQDAQQTKIELDTKHPPNVDMIVIVSEDAQHIQGLEKYAQDRRGKLIRNDIPVTVMSSQYDGSGNVYLDVLLQAKRDLESPVYKQQYPHLKSWKQSRVMFVFHGKDASKNDDIQYSLLDAAIKNGYRLARNDPQDIGNEGGNIIVYSRDAYFGPIPYFPESGVALLTSKVNRDELKGYGFVNTGGRFASNTEDTVFQVYEKLDLDALEDDPEPLKAGAWRNLEDRFMLSNHVLKQFPVLNGRVSIAADAVEMLTKIAEHTQANNLWEQWPRHLSGDLLIPMIMISKLDKRDLEKEINDYVDQRSEWGDLHEDGGKLENGQLQMVQGYLEGFYETIEKYYSDIPINAFLPHSKMSLLMHVSGDKSAETSARFKRTLVVQPGGVDLSGARDVVQFDQNAVGPEASSHGPVLTSLKFFKGFDFQVIEYQPISNPVEFFSSMARPIDHHEA